MATGGVPPDHERLVGLVSRIERLADVLGDWFREREAAHRSSGNIGAALDARRRRKAVQTHCERIRQVLLEEHQRQ